MLDFPSTTLLQNPMQIRGSDPHSAGGGVSLPAQALQNLQRLLQSQMANPLQLQQALQRQQLERQQAQMDQGRKQLQGMLTSLQEQYQMNLLQQQSSLGSKGGSPAFNQQLQRQQQQIMAQMQMTQQALILGGGGGGVNPETPPKEDLPRERHSSENLGSIGSDGSLKENRPDNNNLEESSASSTKVRSRQPSRSESLSPPASVHNNSEHLYHRGHCHWPGCETPLPDIPSFARHLSESHTLDDKAVAQTRVQLQIVSQLELQLKKEKDKLRAMMLHLNLETSNGELKEVHSDIVTISTPPPSHTKASLKQLSDSRDASPDLLKTLNRNNNNHTSSPPPPPCNTTTTTSSSPLSALTAAVRSPLLLGNNSSGSLRPKPPPQSEKNISLPPGFDERRGRGDRGNPNLDPAMDIQQNREFYKHNDVRPPYTYAALIRYAVQEAPDQQLTLHEIYNWFTTTFAYFRRNAASWKNAVRHNLSLHKCFMRVENVKGAVWTVDDEEYHRRRPPRGSAPPSMSPSVSGSPTLTPAAPSLIDTSLSSMLAAHGPSFFNQAFLQQAGQRAAAAAAAAAVAAASQHMEDTHPQQQQQQQLQFFDNRSTTPGSLDYSRVKSEMEDEEASSSCEEKAMEDDRGTSLQEEEDEPSRTMECLEETECQEEEEEDDAQDLSLTSVGRGGSSEN